MQRAFFTKDKQQIKAWIDSTPDINSKDEHEFSAVMWAVKLAYAQILETLVKKGCDIHARNAVGDTALHIACQLGNTDAVQYLVNAGAQVNVVNDHGNVPLHYACFWRWREISMFLLGRGAILNAVNSYGKTPLDFTTQKFRTALMEEAQRLGLDMSPVKMKVRSTEKAELEAKVNYMAKTRQQFFDTQPGAIKWGDLMWKTDTCDVLQARVNGVNTIIKRYAKNATSQLVSRFKEELGRLQKVHNPFLVTLIGGCYDLSSVCAIYEASQNTSLSDILHDPAAAFDSKDVLTWAHQICEGMAAMHKASLQHLNLKSRNVLIIDGKTAQVMDYGFYNTLLGQFGESSDKLLEPEWIAPELLKNCYATEPNAADVYSFGILLYEMVTRQLPYANMNGMIVGLKVAVEGERPIIPMYVPAPLSELMQLCWHENPQHRPQFSGIAQVIEKMIEIESM